MLFKRPLLAFSITAAIFLYPSYGFADDWATTALQKHVDEGNTDAMLCLSDDYAVGFGVKESLAQAIALLRKAAALGDTEAEFFLGRHYEKGDWGLDKDQGEAFKWYHKAAVGGHSAAQMLLGDMYREGKVVPKNDELATEWYKKSAQQGHPSGELLLGFQYEAGLGVKQDLVEAYKWQKLGIAGGADHPSWKQVLKSLTERLSSKQIEEGNRRIAEFKPKWVTKTHEPFCRSMIEAARNKHN